MSGQLAKARGHAVSIASCRVDSQPPNCHLGLIVAGADKQLASSFLLMGMQDFIELYSYNIKP